jgi:hypothetical protein
MIFNLRFIAAIIVIVLIAACYKVIENHIENKKIIEYQKELLNEQRLQLEHNNEIIETKIFQQKIIGKTTNNTNVISRREFLQSVFEERQNSDK